MLKSTLNEPMLRLAGVSQSYSGMPAPTIHELSFRLQQGRIGCLLGPSGCGKTTVLRCIAGFEAIDAGEIRLNGVAVSGPHHVFPVEQRRVGMVFQDYALFPHLNVEDNVGFGLHGLPRPQRSRRVGELLETVSLAHARRKFLHQLSGGQQQRVALARALAPRPDLLLLDEPFSNLDTELRARLSREVRSILKQQNATAILVTHDEQEAFAMADEIGILSGGVLQQWSSPYDLYHHPANRFVANFIGDGVFLPGRLTNDGQVEIELGRLPAAKSNGVAYGSCTGAVDVLLRPDDVIHDDASRLRAEVQDKAFRGADVLYTLRLASGRSVLSLAPSHHEHAIGDRIGIRLETHHAVMFEPAG